MLETKISEEELRKTFYDTLNKKISLSGIIVVYREDKENRIEIGVPYAINNNHLEIGPYFKDFINSIPNDFHERKKEIPISDIIKYKRIELLGII